VKPEKVLTILMFMRFGPRRAGAALVMSLALAPAAGHAVPDGSFWGKVGAASGAGPARHGDDSVARDDIAALFERVEGEESSGRLEAACGLLERALPRFTGNERTAAWFRLGVVRSKLGRYREAAVAYAAVVADGAADSAVYSNFAEVLMAAGRLPDAEARYRDAISTANDLGVGDRRERAHELALAYYGLAVALDRDEQPVAARETMLRALAHDPTAAVLKLAAAPGGDLFFVPEGDVLYYLGLAAEVEGRDGDAQEAFRDFVNSAPRGRWARAAEAHLARKATGVRRANGGEGATPRILAHGTVLATGGIAAPLVDAAWRDQLGILDDCLEGVRVTLRATMRMAIEMDVDARGKITRVVAKVPPPFDERFARCVESATKQRLRLSVPAPGRPTLARTELIIGTAPSGGR
jgi:tetratricopeptide (TPR) repeat protein